MTKIPRILARVYGEPWAILPEVHRAICTAVDAKSRGEAVASIMPADMEEQAEPPVPPEAPPSCMVIPVHGILGKHLDLMETLCGGCDLDNVCAMLEAAADDDGVEFVMLDFRSPGGTVTGIAEAADEIAELAKLKPVGAFTDSQCCSAAYWMASQCSTIFATPSATLGSVGVIAVMFDESRALANQGITPNEFRSGRMKGMGASYRPMTEEEKTFMQARVDGMGHAFRAVITAARGVAPECLEGQVFDGRQAVKCGMADALVADIDEAIDLFMG